MTLSANPLFRNASVLHRPSHFAKLIDRQPADYMSWVLEQYRLIATKPVVGSVLSHTLVTNQIPAGLVCEFGVATGNSTNVIAKALAPRIVHGFDTFEGLPQDWVIGDMLMPKGTIAVKLGALTFEPNVRLLKGLFSETLPRFMAEHGEAMGFMHVDCDTYPSTVDIFKHAGAFLREGTVIVFDEILGDLGLENELLALWEFSRDHGLQFEWLASGGHSWSPATQRDFMRVRKFSPLNDLKLLLKNLKSLTSMRKIEECTAAAAIRVVRAPKGGDPQR